jgi:hypothetical protein
VTSDDPRRQRPVEIKWVGAAAGPRTIGRIEIDGEHWGNVEWSYRREVWCIEDIWGGCLQHTDHIRGQEASRDAAVELAKEMIRDGRMPTLQEARATCITDAKTGPRCRHRSIISGKIPKSNVISAM